MVSITCVLRAEGSKSVIPNPLHFLLSTSTPKGCKSKKALKYGGKTFGRRSLTERGSALPPLWVQVSIYEGLKYQKRIIACGSRVSGSIEIIAFGA